MLSCALWNVSTASKETAVSLVVQLSGTVSLMRDGIRNGTDETARVVGGMLSAVSVVACGWRDHMVPVRSQSLTSVHKSKLLANHDGIPFVLHARLVHCHVDVDVVLAAKLVPTFEEC